MSDFYATSTNNAVEIDKDVYIAKDTNLLKKLVSGANVSITAEDLDGITKIGQYAFYNAGNTSNLRSIEFPQTLRTIEAYAFYGCKIENIEFPGPDMVNLSGSSAFSHCSYLTSISLAHSIISNTETFAYCTSLTTLELPNGWNSGQTGAMTFEYCTNLETVELNSISDINTGCFIGCQKLKNINLSNVKRIETQAFLNCTSLEAVELTSITVIGDSAFNGCSGLQRCSIGEGLQNLYQAAFYNCKNLTEIKLPDGISSIPGNVFNGCTELSKVEIGAGVTSIGSMAFYSCRSLVDITCLATTPPTMQSNSFNVVPATCIIKVPAQSVEAYKSATNWSKRADYIQAI